MGDDSPFTTTRGLFAGLSKRRADGTQTRTAKSWVAEASGAPEDATVLVTELACSEPGCPPYEVVMAVLAPDGTRRQRTLHVRLAELTRERVFAAWGDGEDTTHEHDERNDKDS